MWRTVMRELISVMLQMELEPVKVHRLSSMSKDVSKMLYEITNGCDFDIDCPIWHLEESEKYLNPTLQN